MFHEELPHPVNEANANQAKASDPRFSVFVSASAGSGKTKLLVDRLLRLMLPSIGANNKLRLGTPPHKIQCLTYSKAAAAEMANRLQKRLSKWVGCSDEELGNDLIQLQLTPSPEIKKAARTLFAQVLDLPGGMRIETNHAFCQSILQRFPLEASIIPQFRIIEEGDNILTFKRAFNETIGGISEKVKQLSPLVNNENFLELLQELQKREMDIQPILRWKEQGKLKSYLHTFLGLPSPKDKYAYLESICRKWCEEDVLRTYIERIKKLSSKKVKEKTAYFKEWLDLSCEDRVQNWERWKNCFLNTQNKPWKFPQNKEDDKTVIEYLEKKHIPYVEKVVETLNRYDVYEYTLTLFAAFIPIWDRYQELKRDQGVLNYNDLIHHTLKLMDDPGAAWILYKLDGGLDHILLDEVQDNSAEQWQIAARLSTEFFSGLGREDNVNETRTVFAVGDYKQSIYSFQGAQPAEFAAWRQKFKRKVEDAGQCWQEPQLTVSFRSSQIILDFVDQVFSSGAKKPLKGVWNIADESKTHRAAHTQKPGRIDIWPLFTSDQPAEEIPEQLWNPLTVNEQHSTADQALADCLADWIQDQIGKIPPYGGEPVKAGDILILIRQRSSFSKALIRALKSRNVPLANLVKTQLLDQIAVKDLLALCETLLLPQDDLNFACVLKSPLGGLDEDSLMQLAAPREKGQTLWDTLRDRHAERQDWHDVWTMLSHLFSRVDYITPYALLMEMLGEYHGRAKLLARLGGEVVEAVDELLAQALHYETIHIPSLQGFLYWLKQSRREIKNEAESGIEMVRIMTVHGAKGLQGRLVILPDTMNAASQSRGFQSDRKIIWQEYSIPAENGSYPVDDGYKEDVGSKVMVPLYIPNSQFSILESTSSKIKQKDLEQEENNRLLYVALTRASEWLLICGYDKAAGKGKDDEDKDVWYTYCRNAITELPFQSQDFFGTKEGCSKRDQHLFIDKKVIDHVKSPKKKTQKKSVTRSDLPAWMGANQGWKGHVLPSESSSLVKLIPSRPNDVLLGKVPSVHSPLQASMDKDIFYRGRVIHELLQYLPEVPENERYELALDWVRKSRMDLSDTEISGMIEQVIHVLNSPELAVLFDSESLTEQPITGIVNDIVITGQIDRMRILPDRILLCDFKSGRKIPASIHGIPVIYLKQMAAYWVLLKEIYPTHKIQPLLVWTDALKIMNLPDSLLKDYIPG